MNHYLAQAASPFSIKDVFQPAKIYDDVTGIGKLASDIILILTSVAGAVSIIFIIIAGIKIITASGDEKKMAAASATLTYAIIGLVVTILAFVILRVIQFVLKANVAIT